MNNFKLYGRMVKYLKPYGLMLLSTVILSFCVVTFESLSLWFTGSLINTIFKPGSVSISIPTMSIGNLNEILKYWSYKLIQRNSSFESLKLICIFVIIFFLFKNLFTYLKSLITFNLLFFVSRDFRNELYGHALILPVTYYDRNHSGDILSMMFNDIAAINNSLTGTFEKLITEPLRLLFFISILIIINPVLTLIVFCIYPVLGVLIAQIGKTVRRRSRRSLESISGLSSIMNETVQCIRAVKMFNMNEFEENRFKKENQHFTKINFRTQIYNALSSPLTETLGVLMVAGLLWFGGRDVLMGKNFTAEDFLRFLAFLFMMFQPLKSLSSINNTIQNGLAASERVFSLMDTPPELITKVNESAVPVFNHGLRFDNVGFSYPGTNEEVLHDISFEIKKGQIGALVGSSGSGKSTILDLLPRFYEIQKGVISVDGIDTKTMDLVSLRNLFGIVSQETILFNASVFENITYGMNNASREQVLEVAQAAQAWEFIDKMPQGLNTIIGERGVMLSGGQKQRLSIARALLKNPKILILDEATSALDTESERLVQNAINTLMQNRTALVVAHRLSTISHADTILVLEDGRLTEQGTHEELLRLQKRYKYLYDIQFSSGAV